MEQPNKKRKRPVEASFLLRGTFDPFSDLQQLPEVPSAPEKTKDWENEVIQDPAEPDIPPPPPEGWSGLYHPTFTNGDSIVGVDSPQMSPRKVIMSAVAHRRVEVPVDVLRQLNGPGGGGLHQMQEETGCRLTLQPHSQADVGGSMGILSLTGVATAVAATEQLILRKIDQVQHQRLLHEVIYHSPNLHPAAHPTGVEYAEDVLVPSRCVGLIIGPAGETIRSVASRSGAAVAMTKDSEARRGAVDRKLRICGNLGTVALAKQLIVDILREELVRHGGVVAQSLELKVPERMIGLLVGRDGNQIKQWQQLSATRIQISAACAASTNERLVTVVGSPAGALMAKQLISAKMHAAGSTNGCESVEMPPQTELPLQKSNWEVGFDNGNPSRIVYIDNVVGSSQHAYPFTGAAPGRRERK